MRHYLNHLLIAVREYGITIARDKANIRTAIAALSAVNRYCYYNNNTC
ncbi:MAG: hypothetical protein QXE10_06085 [Desulfurococcaceae archaeon]